jgi:hypothetical protein
MSKKLATTVYITEQQQALLKELNTRSKVPVAEFIRQGIDLVIHRYRDLLPGQLDLPLGQGSDAEFNLMSGQVLRPQSQPPPRE